MGNDNAGSVFHDLMHGTLYGLFGQCMNIGSRFVMNKDLGGGYICPADGNKLSLSLAYVVNPLFIKVPNKI